MASSRSTPEVAALSSHNFLQYLALASLQVRPEKLLTVSAATHHLMQPLLVKSRLAPSCCVGGNAASASVKIVGHPGHSTSRVLAAVGLRAVAANLDRSISGFSA